jgi:hypothetical protein
MAGRSGALKSLFTILIARVDDCLAPSLGSSFSQSIEMARREKTPVRREWQPGHAPEQAGDLRRMQVVIRLWPPEV